MSIKMIERPHHGWLVSAIATLFLTATASAQSPRPFDFSDAFYKANGINPANILARVNGADGVSVVDRTDDPTRRNVRVLATNGGFDASGQFAYFNIFGVATPDTFTQDAAGRQARALADKYRVFIFPRTGTDPLGISARRQDNVLDTRDGYFSNNPLGIWTATFVSFTPRAFSTADGRKALADLAQKNGLDLDGTPMVTSASDLDNLAQNGFVALRTRAKDGSQGFPWIFCPPFKDPRGAIAPDATLSVVTLPDGSPLVPSLVAEFLCLQRTGDFCQ
jgi:hypothetical protein